MVEPVLPLTLRDLTYTVGNETLLQNIHLDVAGGGITVILGPNGAGKSLLLRLMHGLLEQSSGTISFGGQAMTPLVQRRQAMVFQKPVLLRRSVAANLSYVLKVHGVAFSGRRAQVANLLRDGGLDHKSGQAARTLSGGEKQRLAVIRAMASAPEILFLDEPTSSLDPAATEAIEALITVAALAGTKIIIVTHDLGQAKRLADDVVFCHQGKIAEHTLASRFFEAPVSEAAGGFLAGKLIR
jgi:tungstate transport system ATP-binding protein